MNEPSPLLERLLKLEREKAFARGVLVGIGIGVVGVVLLLFAAGAKAQTVPRAALEMRRDVIREGRGVWGLDAPTAAFAAQIHQESGYRTDAVSPVGAAGLAQFMPSTEKWIKGAYPADLGDGGALNPRWALRALVRYDRYLWERVRADSDCERFAFALAAYNGGLGHVLNRQRMSLYPGLCLGATCDIRPAGVSEASQRENSQYPRRILLTLEPIYVTAGFGLGACS